jgi:hypothetical protein
MTSRARAVVPRPATDRLLASNPFEFTPENRELFLASFREMARVHYEGCVTFRRFWEHASLKPEDVLTEADLERVPPLMVHLLKEREMASIPESDAALILTSSGTSGQKSRMVLSQGSLDRVKKLAWTIHRDLGMASEARVNYLCFTYDPHIAKDLGTAFTDELLTSFTARAEVYYALQWDSARDDFVFNDRGVVEALTRFARSGLPTRILGFPAFLHKILMDYDLQLNLGPDSWVQTGGGWKTMADKEIPKHEFRRLVSTRLGLPEANIRDMFGMVEHGIPYCDCAKGKLHVPNYARVLVRSPHDLRVLPEGERGLLHFFCTYNDSYPSMSLLTTDWGRLGRCDCGLPGQTVEILGRAGTTKHKGCAIKATELLDTRQGVSR